MNYIVLRHYQHATKPTYHTPTDDHTGEPSGVMAFETEAEGLEAAKLLAKLHKARFVVAKVTKAVDIATSVEELAL